MEPAVRTSHVTHELTCGHRMAQSVLLESLKPLNSNTQQDKGQLSLSIVCVCV